MDKTNEFKEYLIQNIGPSYVQTLDKTLNNIKINSLMWYTHLGLIYHLLNTIENNSIDFDDPDIISYTLAYIISVKDKFEINVWWCDDRQYYLIINKFVPSNIIKNMLNGSKPYLIDKDGKASMIL